MWLSVAAALVVVAAEAVPPRLCGLGLEVRWSINDSWVPPTTKTKPKPPMSYELNSDCFLPSVNELVELLADRHVHLSGDSTLRMPVQHFECAWSECTTDGGLGKLRSTRPGATEVDHTICAMALDESVQWEWLGRPMGRFALSFERATHIRLQRENSHWWKKWVDELDVAALPETHEPNQVAEPADKPRRTLDEEPGMQRESRDDDDEQGPRGELHKQRGNMRVERRVPRGQKLRPRAGRGRGVVADRPFARAPAPRLLSTREKSGATDLGLFDTPLDMLVQAKKDRLVQSSASATPSASPSASPSPPLRLSDAERMERLPDALVIGNWAWHARFWDGPPKFADFLDSYETELRTFLLELVDRPSYQRWWAHGRLFWRFALPSEVYPGNPKSVGPHFDRQYSVDACNAIAARLLKEIAPGIVRLDQSRLLLHADAGAAAAAIEAREVRLTTDGLHYRHPIQVVLMRHTLTVIIRNMNRRAERSSRALGG